MNDTATIAELEAADVDAIIQCWENTGGKERANYQLFLTELTRLLGLPGPEPATRNDEDDAYVFERRVDIDHPDGTATPWPEKPEQQQEAEEELLQRLVNLNHQRAAEEAKGKVRWLRPEYQAPEQTAVQGELATDQAEATPDQTTKRQNDKTTRLPWPRTLQEQVRAVRSHLATGPMDAATLASHYKRKPESSVTQVLEALMELGMVTADENHNYRMREA